MIERSMPRRGHFDLDESELMMNETPHTDTYPAGITRQGNAAWREEYDPVFTPNYGQRRLAIVRGQGTRVWDAEGKEYLDFLSGISVNNLGHCHPRITKAIQEQAATLVHCSNYYYIPLQIELAKLLVDNCFADRIIFGNSGAEANEAAIKIARRYTKEQRGEGHHEIITMHDSFHGRTMATLTATGQDKVKTDFEPLIEGFKYARFNDLDSVRAQVTEATAAIMIEPIQGEGGIRLASEAFLTGLRELCDEKGLLLIFDEIQCGLGRAGSLFAHQFFGVEPDIMTLAKSLGGGLAMGAMLCRAPIAEAFGPGSHGSTMAGNALTAAAGHAYISELIEGGWSAKADEMGQYMMTRLAQALEASRNVREIRGRGLMLAVELEENAPEVLLGCEADGLLINVTAGQVLRFLPPLNITRDEVEQAVEIVARNILKFEKTAGCTS